MFNDLFVERPRLKGILSQGIVALLIAAVLYVVFLAYGEFRTSVLKGGSAFQNTITVNGIGEAVAIPDTGVFSFTMMERAAVVADAQKKVSEKMTQAMTYLKEQGVEEKDIKTVSYSINPQYEYNQPVCSPYGCPPVSNPKIVGYEVQQATEVKVRKLEKAGDLLSGVGATGPSYVSGLSFSVDDEDVITAEARAKAIDNAKEKAAALSKRLGVSLVRVVNFYENGGYMPYAKEAAYGMGGDISVSAPRVSVSPGETKVLSNVSITYEIR